MFTYIIPLIRICVKRFFLLTFIDAYHTIILQGDRSAARQSPFLTRGRKSYNKAPLVFCKGGGCMMITYSEFIQTIGVIIAIAGFVINAVKAYHDIKKK